MGRLALTAHAHVVHRAREPANAAVHLVRARVDALPAAKGVARIALRDALAVVADRGPVRRHLAHVTAAAAVGSIGRRVSAGVVALDVGVDARKRTLRIVADGRAVGWSGADFPANAAVRRAG